MKTSVCFKRICRSVGDILADAGIGVLPTDTIYGIVGLALNRKTVERIYKLRRRNRKKPMIILIGSVEQLKSFDIKLDGKTKATLRKIWPHLRRGYGGQAGKISIILPCRSKKFVYLHRGKNSLAFRLPAKVGLRKLLLKIGPLVAPSANLEGEKPARTIREAKKYFGDRVDFYVDGGSVFLSPSKIVVLKNGRLETLR